MQVPEKKPLPRREGGGLAWVALAAIAFLGGCYPKGSTAPGPLSAASVTWAATRWPGVTADALSAGRNHFLTKCNGCHEYPDLTAIPDGRWPDIVERMAKKSQLGAGEREAVLRFVLASRSERAGR